MNNKRTLLVTGTTDIIRSDTSTDNTMREVFDLTLPSKINYIKKHNYDILILHSFGDDKNNRYKNTEIGFLRAVKIFEALESYDYVMWIDADALITNKEMTIDDFKIDESVFYCSYDWMGTHWLSTGNFIIKNTEYTKQFIEIFYYLSKENNFTDEQTTINCIWQQPNLNKLVKALDHKYLNAVPSIDVYTTNVWGKRPSPINPWSKGDFLLHITGVGNNDRLKILKENFSEYL